MFSSTPGNAADTASGVQARVGDVGADTAAGIGEVEPPLKLTEKNTAALLRLLEEIAKPVV